VAAVLTPLPAWPGVPLDVRIEALLARWAVPGSRRRQVTHRRPFCRCSTTVGLLDGGADTLRRRRSRHGTRRLGNFHDLAVVEDRDGHPVHVASEPLGDRVRVEPLTVKPHAGLTELQVGMTSTLPTIRRCCPSVSPGPSPGAGASLTATDDAISQSLPGPPTGRHAKMSETGVLARPWRLRMVPTARRRFGRS
jgi:hypothetical protein